MLSRLLSWGPVQRIASSPRLRRPRPVDLRSLARRLLYFWVVWSALLIVHEMGHALIGIRQGLTVRRVTVGAGPIVWRADRADTEFVLRLVPVAGVTKMAGLGAHETAPRSSTGWHAWGQQAATLGGGLLATLLLAVGVASAVAIRERRTRKRSMLGRFIVADAVVLTLFNLLPVPPLDGGRAVVGAIAAARGAPLSSDILFWVQLGGLALAVVPMLVWTRWTTRIDAAAMRWGAPMSDRA
jgi:membrane-associated protease RseP (regulator of RpoE activity)